MFGEERLTEVLSAHRAGDVHVIENAVFQEVDRFAGAAPQYDDATLMILRRDG
jgi:serine phosphatase RsbU (regulator of sigma subunit)